MTKSPYKHICAAGFVIISVVFLSLRLKTLNHLLVWDEAWNMLALRAFLVNAPGDPFYSYFFYHPPLYMIFAILLEPFEKGFDVRLESLSLLFSYALLVITYLLGRKIGGVRYGLISALFLTLMPFSIAHDTWIKSDSLASALGYLSLILLLKRNFFWCAVALSFSLLAKESAAFFIISVSILIFILKERGPIRKLSLIYIVIFILTAWWFKYFSAITNVAFRFYFSMQKGHPACQLSWLYHFKKLVIDLGMPLLVFFIMGLCYLAYLIFYKKQYRWLVPIVAAASIYITTSLVVLKEPWFCLSAGPALAMISAGGALWTLRMSKRFRTLLPLALLLAALATYKGLSFSYDDYHAKVYPHGWPGSIASKKIALYLNERMKDDDRLMITRFTYWDAGTHIICPIFVYYWRSHPVEIITGKEKVEDIMKDIVTNKISWFVVVDSMDPQNNLRPLIKAIRRDTSLGDPDIAGWSCVWNTEKLWAKGQKR